MTTFPPKCARGALIVYLIVVIAFSSCTDESATCGPGDEASQDCVDEASGYPPFVPNGEVFSDVPAVPRSFEMSGGEEPAYEIAGAFTTREPETLDPDEAAELREFYESSLAARNYNLSDAVEKGGGWSLQWVKGDRAVMVGLHLDESTVYIYLCPPADPARCTAKTPGGLLTSARTTVDELP